MNRRHGFDVTRVLVVSMALAFASVAVARANSLADVRLTAEARSALRVAKGARASSVLVDTRDGQVTLYGKVQSENDRADAVEAVRGVAGVVRVRDLLQVVARGNRARERRSDDAVKRDIQRTLGADRSLDDSDVTVKSVGKGVVLLSGYAASSNDAVRALRAAARRPGVRRIVSEIEVADAVVLQAVASNVGRPILSVPSVRRDGVDAEDDAIRWAAERALDDLDSGENADVYVVVKGGVVWLNGTVPTWQGNDSRVSAVRSVTGVRSIFNGLRVVATNDHRR